MLLGPALRLEVQAVLDVCKRAQCPDTGPDERDGPADHIGSIFLDGEDESANDGGSNLGTDTPEQCQSMEHLAEIVAGFVSGVESLTEGDIATTVDSDNVFDDPVNSGTQLRSSRHRRDTEGRRNAEQTHTILDDQF